MDKYDFNNATKEIIGYMNDLNLYIDVTKPWLAKGEELKTILNDLIIGIWNLSIIFSPIIVDSKKIIEHWLDKKITDFSDFWFDFKNKKISKIDKIFIRI